MKLRLSRKLRSLMLPGLKRWIVIILMGISVIIIGVLLLLGYHPLTVSGIFLREVMEHAADVLPHRISGIIVVTGGGLIVCIAVAKVTLEVLQAYLPADRESIPEVLFKRRHLGRGPRVVVIGGGTGLSNLLRGLKAYTNNITAIVTVGDDGGSSGRLREELGVLPPGDIRNCITALADEDKLVTELFRYRFESGQGLEGHSFGNLFLTALCDITKGDMLEAARVASRVLNSCGQVLPSTLESITLVAELDDGRIIRGESTITGAKSKIKGLSCEPVSPPVTPEAKEAITNAELIVLGPGSLYTSIIPNLLVPGVCEAIQQSNAPKIYVCNVITQQGETDGYSVADHVRVLLKHAGITRATVEKFLDAVLVNDQLPQLPANAPGKAVKVDTEHIEELGVKPIPCSVLSDSYNGHHDPDKLAEFIINWMDPKNQKKVNKEEPVVAQPVPAVAPK